MDFFLSINHQEPPSILEANSSYNDCLYSWNHYLKSRNDDINNSSRGSTVVLITTSKQACEVFPYTQMAFLYRTLRLNTTLLKSTQILSTQKTNKTFALSKYLDYLFVFTWQVWIIAITTAFSRLFKQDAMTWDKQQVTQMCVIMIMHSHNTDTNSTKRRDSFSDITVSAGHDAQKHSQHVTATDVNYPI